MSRTSGLSINLFLSERTWNGLVVADASSHNVKVFTAPKTKLDELVSRDDIKEKSGVYLLTGPNLEGGFGLEGYIGESDDLAVRLRSHAKRKRFWSRAYIAISKDSWLSKSHIRFLEARLVAVAKTAPLLARVNNLKQDLSYDRLTDGEAANLEDFIGLLSIIMPAIGCPLFAFPNSIHLGSVSIDHHIESSTGKAGTYFELVKGAARGIAYLRDGAFWVSKGSTARVEEYSSLRDGYRKTRAALVECGILVCDHHRGLLVFTQDVPFNSPSDAAAVIGTTSLNGRKEWKVLGKGISYSDWDAAQISNSK